MKDKVLIVGIDSLIGACLEKHLVTLGYEVIGTTRREDKVTPRISYLDLLKNVEKWQIPSGVKTAVICAAVSRIEACSKDPQTSYKINVTGSTTLVRRLVSAGVYTIYLSTNQVFAGETPFTKEDAAFTGINTYGQQKAELERNIIGMKSPHTLIVRLTKVFGKDNALFEGWIKNLREGKKITPFSDMVLAPVPLALVVKILGVTISKKLKGILQISAPTEITYADAAKIGAKSLGLDENLIAPIKTNEAKYFEPFPKHTTLDTHRLNQELKISLPEANWVIEQAFSHPEKLEEIL